MIVRLPFIPQSKINKQPSILKKIEDFSSSLPVIGFFFYETTNNLGFFFDTLWENSSHYEGAAVFKKRGSSKWNQIVSRDGGSAR